MGAICWLLPRARFAPPNARIMIHQLGGVEGQASDISIQAREILRLKDCLNEILAAHTGRDLKDIQRDTERDYFMSSDEACAYGLIDETLTRKADAATKKTRKS